MPPEIPHNRSLPAVQLTPRAATLPTFMVPLVELWADEFAENDLGALGRALDLAAGYLAADDDATRKIKAAIETVLTDWDPEDEAGPAYLGNRDKLAAWCAFAAVDWADNPRYWAGLAREVENQWLAVQGTPAPDSR